MSDTSLRVIPSEPGWVPSATARQAAIGILQRALPRADDVTSQLTDTIRFIDCGGNFETVCCPRCGTDLGEWWTLVMEAAHEEKFADLRVTTPCCRASTTLNDLVYMWPAGFARFSLEAVNPGIGSLPERVRERLEAQLGCPVRVIWAYY